MGRKIKTEAGRTISNTNPRGQYIGYSQSTRVEGEPGLAEPVFDIPRIVDPREAPERFPAFDSLAAMSCIAFLRWHPKVARFRFEPKTELFAALDELPPFKCVPDFGVTLVTGQLGYVEGKSSRAKLSAEERAHLELEGKHCERRGLYFKVLYRDELRASGFIDTIMLLSRYDRAAFPKGQFERALNHLRRFDSEDLPTWRGRARAANIPIGLLYQLLYQKLLPLTFRPLQRIEFRPWLA